MERISSRKNPKAAHIKKLGSNRAYRYECGEFICDGAKLLREACMHGAEITCVFTSQELPFELPDGVPAYLCDTELIEAVSPMKNPQSVLFSCRIPEKGSCVSGSILVLENVQDPGNVGTMLRTANAMGIGTVMLAGACADPYGPKTVRASMGAVFRQHFLMTDLDGIRSLRDGGIRLVGAALGEKSKNINDAELKGAAVVIGNEGQGISDELLEMCDELVIIPMAPGCESLNASAAATIIMWEMSGRWRH
ncbi:MAG: RNA methyltransferase [Oscillospiraceae bacterium]|nr:RNA methyltransferase [Oscillospiraceae bacterium]